MPQGKSVSRRVRKINRKTNETEIDKNKLTRCTDEDDPRKDSHKQGTSTGKTRTNTCSVELHSNGMEKLEAVPHEDHNLQPEHMKQRIKPCSIRLTDCRTNSRVNEHSERTSSIINVCDQDGVCHGSIQVHQYGRKYHNNLTAPKKMDSLQTPSEIRCSSRLKSTSSMSTPQPALSDSSATEDLFGFEKLLKQDNKRRMSFEVSPIVEKPKVAKRVQKPRRKSGSKQPKPWEGLLESSVSDIFKKGKKQKQKDKNEENQEDLISDVRLYEYGGEIKDPIFSLSFDEADEGSSPKKKVVKAKDPSHTITDARLEIEEVLTHELVVE